MSRGSPSASGTWIEIQSMTGLILSYIWLWQDAFPGHAVLVGLLFLAIAISGHRRRGETAREIGFRLDNLGRAAGQALLFVGPVILAPLAFGAALGTLHYPELARWPRHLLGLVLWALVQQYGLLGFYYRRFHEVLPGPWRTITAAAATFALFHLPNPFLTPVTLFAGALACWLYRRIPNLPALALAHAGLSVSLYFSLSAETTHGLRVGPELWSRWIRAVAELL